MQARNFSPDSEAQPGSAGYGGEGKPGSRRGPLASRERQSAAPLSAQACLSLRSKCAKELDRLKCALRPGPAKRRLFRDRVARPSEIIVREIRGVLAFDCPGEGSVDRSECASPLPARTATSHAAWIGRMFIWGHVSAERGCHQSSTRSNCSRRARRRSPIATRVNGGERCRCRPSSSLELRFAISPGNVPGSFSTRPLTSGV